MYYYRTRSRLSLFVMCSLNIKTGYSGMACLDLPATALSDQTCSKQTKVTGADGDGEGGRRQGHRRGWRGKEWLASGAGSDPAGLTPWTAAMPLLQLRCTSLTSAQKRVPDRTLP